MISSRAVGSRRRSALLLALFMVGISVLGLRALPSHQHVHGDTSGVLPAVLAGAQHDHEAASAADRVASPSPGAGDSHRGHDSSTVELCLALAGLIAALVLLVLRDSAGARPRHVLRRTPRRAPPPRRRWLDPPCLHRLSILRC